MAEILREAESVCWSQQTLNFPSPYWYREDSPQVDPSNGSTTYISDLEKLQTNEAPGRRVEIERKQSGGFHFPPLPHTMEGPETENQLAQLTFLNPVENYPTLPLSSRSRLSRNYLEYTEKRIQTPNVLSSLVVQPPKQYTVRIKEMVWLCWKSVASSCKLSKIQMAIKKRGSPKRADLSSSVRTSYQDTLEGDSFRCNWRWESIGRNISSELLSLAKNDSQLWKQRKKRTMESKHSTWMIGQIFLFSRCN